MEIIEAMAIDAGALAVAMLVTREVGHSSARASHTIVNTNNRVETAISSRVMVVVVMVVEAHISVP
jgi:hypothetical protein